MSKTSLTSGLRKNWRDIINVTFFVIGFFVAIYTEEIKSFLLSISMPSVVSDLIIAIFVGLFVAGSLSWFLRQITKYLHSKNTTQLHASREELPSLETRLLQAEQEVHFLGISLEKIVRQNAKIIKDTIKRKVSITFLLLDPKSPLVKNVDESMFPATEKAIIATLETLSQLKQDVGSSERNNFIVRVYDALPFFSAVIIDPKTDNARILVEFYLHKAGSEERTHIEISKKEQKMLFEKYWKSYCFVLDRSAEVK